MPPLGLLKELTLFTMIGDSNGEMVCLGCVGGFTVRWYVWVVWVGSL